MKSFKRMVSMVLVAMLLTVLTAPCYAAESAFKEIFQDAVYGGLTGALVGAAVMAFTHKPGDHLDYIGYGGAIGVLAGAAIGTVKSAKSLAELEHGKVQFAIPTIFPDFRDTNSKGQTALVFKAELFRGRF